MYIHTGLSSCWIVLLLLTDSKDVSHLFYFYYSFSQLVQFLRCFIFAQYPAFWILMVYLCSAYFSYLLKSVSWRVIDMVIKSNKDAFVKLIYFPNSVPVKFIKETRFLHIFDYCSGNDKKCKSHPGTDIKKSHRRNGSVAYTKLFLLKRWGNCLSRKLIIKHFKSSDMIKVVFYDSW